MRGSRAPPPTLENLIFLNSNSKISENMPWIPLANSNITRTPLPRIKNWIRACIIKIIHLKNLKLLKSLKK